jgi:cytochrome c5
MKTIILFLSAAFSLSIATQAFSEPRSGEVIFKNSCSSCHATNFPGAPQAHDVKAWQRKYEISQNQAQVIDPSLTGQALAQKTWEILIAKVKNGNKAMPPKGLCSSCTDQEYLNAIQFMMKTSKIK